MRVKCLAQEHNMMSLARARPWAARSRDECTNHKATVPPTELVICGINEAKILIDDRLIV